MSDTITLNRQRVLAIVNVIAAGTVVWSVGVAVAICLLGDRWWIGTMLLFSPRWLLSLPIIAGLVSWPWLTKPLKWVVPVAGLVVLWGVLGFCLPIRAWFAAPETTYRVLTCNVAGWTGGTERLETLIATSGADIVMLQEYNDRAGFKLPESWSSHRDGMLLIASRYPLEIPSVVRRELPGRWPRPVGLFAEVVTPQRRIQLYTLHLLSPRYGLSNVVDSETVIAPSRRSLLVEETQKRGSESKRVAQAVHGRKGSCVVGGDFNMPVESFLFRRDWGQFQDAFSMAGFGIGNTCFVEKQGIQFGARIDHILTRDRWHTLRCWVGPDVGSDHRPVLADVYWE